MSFADLLLRPVGFNLRVEEKPEHDPDRAGQEGDAREAEGFGVVEQPDSHLNAHHGAADHGETQDPVDVAQLPVPDGRDDRLPGNVRDIDSRGHISRKTKHDERRRNHVAAAHTDEAAHHANRHAGQNEKENGRLDSCNDEIKHDSISFQ